jgi:hypothetical protein
MTQNKLHIIQCQQINLASIFTSENNTYLPIFLSGTVPSRATIPTTPSMEDSPLEHRTEAALPIFSLIL